MQSQIVTYFKWRNKHHQGLGEGSVGKVFTIKNENLISKLRFLKPSTVANL